MSDNLDDIELRSEEVQEILKRIPHWMIRWGNTLFLLILILLLILTWLVKYPDIIQASATITTEVPPQKEFASITAKIDSIFVSDSQDVKNNTILATLENSANIEDILYLISIIDTLSFTDVSFYFPINRIPILFLGEIDEAYSTFENNYLDYTLNKELKPFSNEISANETSILELKKRLENLKHQYSLSESELRFKKTELIRNEKLFEKGVISKQEYETKQLEIITTERNYNNISLQLSQNREAISEAYRNSKGTEIKSTIENKQLLKKTIQSYNQLKKVIKDWEYNYVLKSEINGTVTFLKYWNKNQTVMQGDLIFTIIPNISFGYIARINAPSQNSGKIKIGQKVHVKLDNYPEAEFGILEGFVKNISETPDEKGMYLIDVLLPEDLTTNYGKRITFKQEMQGDADIITDDLRLIERFFYQFKDMLSR